MLDDTRIRLIKLFFFFTAGSPGQFSQSPHFWFPSPSTSSASSPRSSFRSLPRRRLSSFGGFSQYSYQYSDDEAMEWEAQSQRQQQMDEFSAQIPEEKKNKKKPKESRNKITGLVISALQFVIDSLR